METLKRKLQELTDKKFYLAMQDHWENEDYEYNEELSNKINNIIEEFKTNGIEVKYQLGYKIEYNKIEG